MIEINSHSIRSRFITCIKEIPFLLYEFGGNGASTARLYIYLLNVPSFSSRYFNKIKRTSRLGRLLALSLEFICGSTELSCNMLRNVQAAAIVHLAITPAPKLTYVFAPTLLTVYLQLPVASFYSQRLGVYAQNNLQRSKHEIIFIEIHIFRLKVPNTILAAALGPLCYTVGTNGLKHHPSSTFHRRRP